MTSLFRYAFSVSSSSDKHEQEVSKNLEQALHTNEKPRRCPDFLSDEHAQVQRRERHYDGEHSGEREDGELLDLRKQRFQQDLRCWLRYGQRPQKPTQSGPWARYSEILHQTRAALSGRVAAPGNRDFPSCAGIESGLTLHRRPAALWARPIRPLTKTRVWTDRDVHGSSSSTRVLPMARRSGSSLTEIRTPCIHWWYWLAL